MPETLSGRVFQRMAKPSLKNNNGSILLRFTCNGTSYTLSKLGKYSDQLALHRAQTIADDIARDISLGRFTASNNAELSVIYNPSTETAAHAHAKTVATIQKTHKLSTLDTYDRWVKTLDISESNFIDHFLPNRKAIERHKPKIDTYQWFLAEAEFKDWCARTFNDRLSYLKTFGDWLVRQKLLDLNPYASIKPRTKSLKDIQAQEKRKPFSLDEIRSILEAFKTDQFCPKSSPWKHSYYAAYVEFLLSTGVRPSEAIGLQVKHLDFSQRSITIESVLARGIGGKTASRSRVRKSTKTGNVRFLPMNDSLYQMLLIQCKDKSPEALVFTSPKGNAIDDQNFLKRIWKPILESLEIPYRVPYACRHTVASHALVQSSGDFFGVAQLLGHSNPQMLIKNYGHSIRSLKLPDLGIASTSKNPEN